MRSLVGVSRIDRVRAGIERELPGRADQRVLRWIGHVERMDDRVPYGQKGVDGESKRRSDTR